MDDTPEACPFCGAERNRDVEMMAKYPDYLCGTMLTENSGKWEVFEGIGFRCAERLRVKAEALDRLEEMVRESDCGVVAIWQSREGFEITINEHPQNRWTGTCDEDLLSAINAAFAQWKEST